MTSQEIFDFVIGKLLEQGERCIETRSTSDKTEFCMYRCNGKKCAFGHLIPDDCYVEGMEKNIASVLLDTPANYGEKWAEYVKANPWLNENRALILGLQNLHDAFTYEISSPQWFETAKNYAFTLGLEFKFK